MRIDKFQYSLLIMLFICGMGFAQSQNADAEELKLLQQQVSQLRQQFKEESERHSAEMKMLREEIELLKQNQRASPKENVQPATIPESNIPSTTVPGPETSPPNTIAQSFNPDISVIGDVLFHAGKNEDNTRKDQFSFRELELAFGSAVDPYGRADLFLGIEEEDGEWHSHLEEGYFTFDQLPYDLKARAGKMYSAVGKANQLHTHAMPWVDKPVVIRRFFGEEGMSEPGAELSWLVSNPWDNYIELTFQAQNNGNEASFAGHQSNDLMYVSHLKNFFDLDRESGIELGGSFATGANAATGGGHRTNVEGLDLTYKWRPAQEGSYKSLTWMNELLFSQKEQGVEDTVDSHGFYSSLEYQFSKRWSVFGRYDYSQFPDDSDSHEDAYSVGLTFRQSEYCFWRLQFEHTEPKGNSTTNEDRDEIFLQLNFGLGPHRAHQY